MPDPVIIPPTPTVVQPSVDTSPGLDVVQKAFDKAYPEIKVRPSRSTATSSSEEPPKPAETPPAPVTPVQTPPEEPTKPQVSPSEPSPEHLDVPSFLEQALRGEPSQGVKAPAAEDEWPEELPSFKTPEESKARYRKWRTQYNNIKSELRTLQEKPALNAHQLARMETLETQNRQMHDVLTRVGVEQSAEFQNNILRPLHQSWNEAARIVKQSGSDPQDLAKAMALSGKAQFEALDELFSGMPESAKAEVNEALRVYRRFEDARRSTVQNAPPAREGIRKREQERAVQELGRQREEMKGIFDRQMVRLRDEAKLELLLRTDSADGKWWNDQGEKIIEQGRSLFLENTDMDKVAMACLLAPAADTYRKLWLASQNKIGKLQKIIKEKIGNEPVLSESGGSQVLQTSEAQQAADLKRPFAEVFLREFHRSQARAK